MELSTAATAFALILPVELPDKTFVATLVLATRFRSLEVWLGVSLAFLVQCTVAVTAGGLLSLLPGKAVATAAGLLFLLGAVVLWRGARAADDQAAVAEAGSVAAARRTGVRAVAGSFGVLFLAEWGDLSQLLTAGLAARYEDPVSVFAGSWVALVTVAGLAVLLGRALLRFVRLSTIQRVGAAVCLLLAVLAAYDVLR